MEFDEIVVKESPGLCRCCLSEGCYKDLGSEYTWMNETEVYADMLLECFDISITQHNEGPNGPNRLICEVCITRLRDACNFKKQVMDSENKFIDMIGRGEFRPKMLIYQTQLKTEGTAVVESAEDMVEFLEEGIDFLDDTEHIEETVTVSEEPSSLPKGKRGRPKKSEVKTEKKQKIPKLDDKPNTSKAVTKDEKLEESSVQEKDLDADDNDKYDEEQRKEDLIRLMTIVIENSSIMPFRFAANKYMCFYCSNSFVESSQLKEHMIEEHIDWKIKPYLRSILGSNKVKLDVTEILCKKCPKKFENFDAFLKHIADSHDIQFNKEIAKCLFTFKLSNGEMSCLECGEKFQFFGSLLKHTYKFHNNYKTFLCEICGQGFVRKAIVDNHIKNMHSLKDRRCEQCDKVFKTRYALRVHNQTEHRGHSLECSKCPEVFSSSYMLKSHLALVHDVKKLQFKCDQCDRIFTVKSALVQHQLRTHEKQKTVCCGVCGFKVFNNALLKKHMVRHTDARPFQCEFCKKSFQRKKNLDLHTRIHTNDKRYACKECGKAFIQVTSYKLHMRVHHGAN